MSFSLPIQSAKHFCSHPRIFIAVCQENVLYASVEVCRVTFLTNSQMRNDYYESILRMLKLKQKSIQLKDMYFNTQKLYVP